MSHNILATDFFKVVSKSTPSDFNFETLTQLYQPFIGAVSIALYTTLASILEVGNYSQLKAYQHEQIMITLGISLPDLNDALKKLEAVGLLRSYRDKNDEQNVLYELIPAKNGYDFFDDDLLSGLLMRYVGQQRFAALLEFFEGNHWQSQKFEETTHEFSEVFRVNNLSQNNVDTSSKKKIQLADKLPKTLDYDLLKSLLQRSFVNEQDVFENIRKVNVIAVMYGLDEIQIVKLLEDAMDVVHNKINWQSFGNLAAQNFEFNLKPDMDTAQKNEKSDDRNVQNTQTNDAKETLLMTFKEYAPMEFLAAIKHEQEIESISNEERITISKAVNDGKLPPAVINVLIHYMLVDQGMSSLNRKYFETTSLDWIKHKIKTPEEAIDYAINWQKEHSKKNVKTSYNIHNSRKRKPFIEKMPYWANKNKDANDNADVSEKDSENLNQDIQQLMREINSDFPKKSGEN